MPRHRSGVGGLDVGLPKHMQLEQPENRKHKRSELAVVGVTLVVFAAIIGIAYCVHWWWGPMRPLTAAASDVHEHYQDGGFSDFARWISARCEPAFFHWYVRRQGLQAVPVGGLPEGCPTWNACPESWWTPPADLTGAYYHFEPSGYRELLAYSAGVLYYDMLEW